VVELRRYSGFQDAFSSQKSVDKPDKASSQRKKTELERYFYALFIR